MKTRFADAARTLAVFAISGACALSLAAAPAAAWATSPNGTTAREGTLPEASAVPAITGVDQLEAGATSWNLLRFAGSYDQPLYYSLSRTVNGVTQYFMQGAPYTLRNEGAADGSLANIVYVDMEKGLPTGGATPAAIFGSAPGQPGLDVAVFASQKDARFGTNPLFEGEVKPVFAKLVDADGFVSYSLLGIRTTQAGQADSKDLAVGRSFYRFDDATAAPSEGDAGLTPPASSYAVYALDSAAPAIDESGAFVVTYREAGTSDDAAFIGTITYVDQDGNIVLVEDVPGIKDGVEVEIKSAFLANQKYYRAINGIAGTKAHLSPLHANEVVSVAEARFADGMTPFEAVIEYIDEAGNLLWSDSVDVLDAAYAYSLPHTFSMSSATGVSLYEFAGVNEEANGLFKVESQRAQGSTPSHTAILDQDAVKLVGADGRLVIKATYRSSASDGDVDFTLKRIDGTNGQQIGEVEKVTVSPDEPVATYTPEAAIDVDGTTYVPWAGNAAPIQFTWESLADEGTQLLQYLYYVPEEYVADEARTVTIQYMNVASGAVIATDSVAVEPDENAWVEIIGPERFTQDGEEYVRLAGQSSPIKHSYFTPADTYTIYYRNVNDVLNAQTVIQRTQIIDTVRTVIIQNPAAGAEGPATPATTGIAATPTTTDDGTVDAGVTQGDATAVINDDNNPLANLDGVDTSTERAIEDDATPLAESLQQRGIDPALSLGLGAAALAVFAILAFIVMRKRRSNDKTRNQA